MNKAKLKKITNVITNVLLYVFLVICVVAVILTLFSKRSDDGTAEIFGYQMRLVTSDSMAKSEFTGVSEYDIKDIPIRSMVFIEVVPDDPDEAYAWYDALDEGDVLTFRYVYAQQVTITHRITNIQKNANGGFDIELEGDNKNSEDGLLTQKIDTSVKTSPNYVIGKVVGQSYVFGLVMSVLMNPIGIILIIMVPCFVIILFEIFKIVKVLNADKHNREQAEKEQKENELNELRRKLAELEKMQTGGGNNEENKEDKQE